ncbi:MAG: hypothetical protein Athens101428_669 [Candidatus Berkelbacteria bacterium Athens1014_28]|uniref:tRNA threonylcarbamoyladenosine biosynthesis protein TsaE n=1 Tax=Candidatus Berkelbacteria bacterium Athens1014_28 TaxID=2017145 RepID=A0A554LKQ5_9BACT|nr:MAG: hypothetical protein Athens101428_669 [Candidatus Berkelbacteria bacterium Athens1014_28]
MDYKSSSLSETKKLAKTFLQKFPNIRLIGLSGDLGSGKTAFVKGVAKFLNIKKNITSPTFVIEKIYPIFDNKKLVHIDACRLSSTADLETIGFLELMEDKNNYIFIEWPERVFKKSPKEMKIINFKYLSENEREISF